MSAMLKDPPRLWRARVAAAGELRARRRRFATRRAVPEPATQRTPPSCPASPEHRASVRPGRAATRRPIRVSRDGGHLPLPLIALGRLITLTLRRHDSPDCSVSIADASARPVIYRSASHGGRAAIRASPRLSRRHSHRCDGVKAKVCRPPMVSQGRDFLRTSQHLRSRLAN